MSEVSVSVSYATGAGKYFLLKDSKADARRHKVLNQGALVER